MQNLNLDNLDNYLDLGMITKSGDHSPEANNWVVLYHRGCSDGFGAACVADYWYEINELVQRKFRPPRFIAVDPNQLTEDLTYHVLDLSEDTVIISIDVGFTREGYQLLLNRFRNVMIIDHHVSTFRELSNNENSMLPDNVIFNNAKAGCVLAWEYFFGKRKIPLLLLYLQDRDLYTFKEPMSREINSALYKNCPPMYINRDQNRPDFSKWKELLLDDKGNWIINMIQIGKNLVPQQRHEIMNMMKSAHIYQFNHYHVVTCYAEKHISDLGHELIKQFKHICHFAMVYRVIKKKMVFISLRSHSDDFDCSQVASKYGGGGHRQAASFRWPFNKFRLIRGRVHLLAKE